ncbi:MAG: aspartate kinase [Deltaproteobacteria bacterium]|nr:aspartate kinase [Deltaproteobacteria bacterium]
MTIVVQKYGGSSVADVEKIGKVADAVVATRSAGHDVVVVVSAMGKTTDQLLELARQVDDNPPRRELDMLVTTGERVTMSLLSMAIQKRGVDAISFTGSQSGIITNDRHFDARIIEVRPHRIEDELARGRVVIIAGYQGMSYKREITTLGRGGSDTTALAMAAALGAVRAEIYSDVDGVYSADPRVVPDAQHLPELSYEQMQTMSVAGAKVLHDKAVAFARDAGIAIHARASFAPGRETRVHGDAGTAATAIVGQKGIVRVVITGDDAAFLAALEVASERGVVVRDIERSPGIGAFHVVLAHSPEWGLCQGALQDAHGDALEIITGLGVVAAVGAAAASPSLALAAITQAGISPLRVTSAPLSTSFLVQEPQVDPALRALHTSLITEGGR